MGRVKNGALAFETWGCTVKYIHPVLDEKARVKQDASTVSHGRERKGLTFGDNRWSKTYVPTGPRTPLPVRGTGGKEDTFVEEATVTFTMNVLKYRKNTQTSKVLATTPGEYTDVKYR